MDYSYGERIFGREGIAMDNSVAQGATRNERGQALILFALSLAVLLGFAAMSIDVGLILHRRTDIQKAADAAALAGAQELPSGGAALAEQKALEWAVLNGYSNGPDYTVTVTTPYEGDADKIEVEINGSEPAVFARALGKTSFPVKARAVATATQESVINAAMLALNPTECNSFTKSGESNIIINNNGGIMVNSSCDPSIVRQGSGSITAAAINYYEEGGYVEGGSGDLDPDPEPVGSPIPDPLAWLPAPDLVALGQSPDSGGTALSPSVKKLQAGNRTIRPGVYFGGLSITSSANVTFQPGIYVMAGGGLSYTGSGKVKGNGVMIYNTYDPWKKSGAGACGVIKLTGGGTYTFTGPTSGDYKDIVFWQDKACSNTMQMVGGGGGTGGVIYLPGATVDLSGGGDLGSIQIIADQIEFSGNGDGTVDFYPYIQIPLDPEIRLIE